MAEPWQSEHVSLFLSLSLPGKCVVIQPVLSCEIDDDYGVRGLPVVGNLLYFRIVSEHKVPYLLVSL